MKTQEPETPSLPRHVTDYVDGWIRREADLVVSSMADDAVYIDRPHPLIPKSGMKAHLEQVAWVNFPDMTFETLALFGNASTRTYAWEWALHASRCGVVVGDKANRTIHCEGVDILRLNTDGLIERSVCHIDRKTLWDSVVG